MATIRSAALGLVLILAGCVAGGPLQPASDTAPAAAQTLAASNGGSVAVSTWGPDAPRAVILALHGYGDYGPSTFSAAATFWAGQGIRTVAPDQRGFGRNPSRGAWPGADALIRDAAAFTAQLRQRHDCTPLIVLGHSMGGGVALAAAAGDLSADGLVLAAPAIWGGERLNPLHRLLAWTAAILVPDQRFTGKGVVRIQASDNIEALRALGRDPLYLRPPSAREIFGLVRITDRAHAAAPQVATPSLLLLGARDQIVPNPTVREVHGSLIGPKDEITYPEGWHLLFRDLQAKRVWTDVADWSLSRKSACR